MAVYREGYSIVNQIQKASKQIFSDSCDFGAPVKKDDSLWNASKQLVNWYQDDESKRKVNRYSTGRSVSTEIVLIDEWSVSDEIKTVEEATDKYRIDFISCTTGACKGYEGYITVQKIN